MTRQLQGILAPLTTPFDAAGEVDWAALERNVEKYRATGLAGALVLGSTGEASHLDREERLAVVRAVSAAWPVEKPLLVGVSFPALRGCLDFVEKLNDSRIAAVLVSVPAYYKTRMDDAALGRFFEDLADRSPYPVLLYNIPRFTGIELSVELVRDLAGHPNIAGMKDSSGNLIYLQKILAATNGLEFQVSSGSAETFGLAARLGIQAGILAVACVLPALAQAVLEREAAEPTAWQAAQRRLFAVSSVVVGRLSVPGVKYAMDLSGFEGGFCRQPLGALSDAEKLEVRKVLA